MLGSMVNCLHDDYPVDEMQKILFCISFMDANAVSGIHIPLNLLLGDGRTSRRLNEDII